MERRQPHAFTLLDLLVVISTIALLMGILMPALRKARDQARTVVCKSNLNHWGKIFYLYAHDNESKFMVWNTGNSPGAGTWMVPLLPYVGKGEGKVRLCPTTLKTQEEGEIDPAKMAWSLDMDGKEHRNSYGINNWCYNLRPGVDNVWGGQHARRRSWRRIDQAQASMIPMFLECYRWGGEVITRSDDAPPNDTARYNPSFGRYCLNRHAYTVNVCFMDGTVRRIRLKGLWDLKWHKEYNLSQPLPKWPEWMQGLPGD